MSPLHYLSVFFIVSSLSLFNSDNEMMEVEDKSADGKTAVEEQKEKDEAKQP